MAASFPTTLPTPIEFKPYTKNQDFLAEDKFEPPIRSQTLIYHSPESKWWITVTFRGSKSKTTTSPDDTVTELIQEEGVKNFDSAIGIHATAAEEFASNAFVKMAVAAE
ncbi:hypothetical protein BJX76DRAFT_359027 [Aspergillus varians]